MFYERLNHLCRKNGTSVAEIAEKVLKVSSGTPTGWKKGTSPKASVVSDAALYFGVSCDYLLGLSDDMENPKHGNHYVLDSEEAILIDGLRQSDENTRNMVMKMASAALSLPAQEEATHINPNPFSSPKDEKISHMPDSDQCYKFVEGKAAAGLPISTIPDMETRISVPAKYLSDKYFIVQAQGDSMIGAGINSGDYCVFQRDAYTDSGLIMYVQVEGSADVPDGTIKRVYRRGDLVELRSENPAYEPFSFPASYVQLNGVLVYTIAADQVTSD